MIIMLSVLVFLLTICLVAGIINNQNKEKEQQLRKNANEKIADYYESKIIQIIDGCENEKERDRIEGVNSRLKTLMEEIEKETIAYDFTEINNKIRAYITEFEKQLETITKNYYENKLKPLETGKMDTLQKEEIQSIINQSNEIKKEIVGDKYATKSITESVETRIELILENSNQRLNAILQQESEEESVIERESIRESIRQSEESVRESIRKEEEERTTTEAYVPSTEEYVPPTESVTEPYVPETEALTQSPTDPQTQASTEVSTHGADYGSKNITDEEEMKKLGKSYVTDYIQAGEKIFFAYPDEVRDIMHKYGVPVGTGMLDIDENGNYIKHWSFASWCYRRYKDERLRYTYWSYCDGTVVRKEI